VFVQLRMLDLIKGPSTLATKVAENGDKKYPKLVAENGKKSRRKRWQKVSILSICRRKRILFVSVFGDFCRQCGQALTLYNNTLHQQLKSFVEKSLQVSYRYNSNRNTAN